MRVIGLCIESHINVSLGVSYLTQECVNELINDINIIKQS
jgi:hypothetical protein